MNRSVVTGTFITSYDRIIIGLLFGIIAAAMVSGCRSHYPAIWDSNPPAPMSLRLKGPQAYVGADASRSNGYNADESNMQGQLALTFSDGGTWYRGGGTMMGYGGVYHASGEHDSTVQEGNLSYYGGGFFGTLAVGVPLKGFTVGVGGTFGMTFEEGAYSSLWATSVTGNQVFLLGGYSFIDVTVAGSHHIGFSAHTGLPGFNSLNLQYFFDGGYLHLGCGEAYRYNGEKSLFGRIALGGGVRVY